MANSGSRKVWQWIVIIILGILIIIQFIPADKTNPNVSKEIETPDQVKSVLEKSCFDCHSNETEWPWYSSIAPASWLVAHDVNEAREHINFSTWNKYTTEDRLGIIEEMWEEVEEGEMPLWYYTLAHPRAKMTDEDKQILSDWVTRLTKKTSVESDPDPESIE